MRKHIVKSILKKEIMDILRDRKTLFMTIILPIILYPALTFLMTFIMSKSSAEMAQKALVIAFNQEPDKILREKIDDIDEKDGRLKIIKFQDKDYKKALDEGKLDAYVLIEQKDGTDNYVICYNASQQDGGEACDRLTNILKDYKTSLTKEKLKQMGVNEKEILDPITYESKNTAENEQVAGYILGIILPFILILGILTGSIYPAIDVMAGEKERGTLETLLTLPISNLELVMGKYLAVAISALVSALLSIISMAFSVGFMLMSSSELTDQMAMQIDFTRLIVPFLITFVCICLFTLVISAVSMCVCSLAKSFKEAQNAMTPLTLVAMILSYSSMIPTLELNEVTAVIPVVNVVLLIKSVLTFKYNVTLLMTVLVINLIFVILAVWVLSKLFKSEEILFGNSNSFSFVERRSDIKKGTMPGMSDGIILYAFVMILMLYVCSYLQVKFKLLGLALTQLVLIGVPVLLSVYIKTDFKKVYSLNKPKLKDVSGSILLWSGVWIVMLLLQNVIIKAPGADNSTAYELQEMILGGNSVATFLVIAVMPAICEEMLFRGFIFTSVKENNHYMRAIVISGLLFGIAHMDLTKFIPITILGMAMGYVIYKTQSIFCTMIMHFLNNGISVILTRQDNGLLKTFERLLTPQKGIEAVLLIIVAALLILTGWLMLQTKKINKEIK